ncbi:transporter [Halieaceae bacterium IMCC14734]|uniref:Transporter n=1 Tax=Candidatus Litorirhabdus singularis TaxID=2518993 RepID=A0ABT3TD72_9GAMM|nr:transporter [Candidatus Litorirhabdus singularis]MCX2980247.1 transporter [Candidatus Litorirhabdus singularis]
MSNQLFTAVVIIGLAWTSASFSQDLEPRNYLNLPIDQSFVLVATAYSEGEMNAAPSVPLDDAQVEIVSTVAGFARTFELAGQLAKFDASVGVQCFDGDGFVDGVFAEASRCGSLDPKVRVAWNFYGAPATTLEQYTLNDLRGTVVGTSFQVGIPLGSYNGDKLINSGANRWFFKPEIGASHTWNTWSVDAAFSVTVFTDNDDFIVDRELTQDNIYALQAHLIHLFPKGVWLAIDANYFWGGKTKKDGIGSADLLKNSRFGATLVWPVSPRHLIKFLAHSSLATTVGNDFNTYGIAWQYRWGD